MLLNSVTLTGADDKTDIQHLVAGSELYPLVEWAILSSSSRAGTPRYPSADWIDLFIAETRGCKRALHLCGSDVDDFLKLEPTILRRASKFDRIQLNFNNRRNSKALEKIQRAAEHIPGDIIWQHNLANAKLVESVPGYPHVLFDSSGGRGVSPSSWPTSRLNWFCGYAGGIGPDNIRSVLDTIGPLTSNHRFWVDMESKLRNSQDEFDIGKCNHVLQEVYLYLSELANPAE